MVLTNNCPADITKVPVAEIADAGHDHAALVEPAVDSGERDVVLRYPLRKPLVTFGRGDDADKMDILGIRSPLHQPLHDSFHGAPGREHRIENDERVIF